MKYSKFEADNKQEITNNVNTKHTIYLYSRYGKGKTHFLKYCERKYATNYVIYRVSAELHQELLSEIKWQKATGQAKKSIVSKMKECDVLLLDDLGNEKMSEFVHEALSVVIDHRYMKHNQDKPANIRTLITSNYSLKELYNIWTEKIGKMKAGQLVSRLKTFGAIELKGRDWR